MRYHNPYDTIDAMWIQDCSHCDGPNDIEAEVHESGGEVKWDCEHCGEKFTAVWQ